MAHELWRLTAVEISERVRTRQVSATEVAQCALARMDALEPVLHAFCTPTPELALAQAAALDAAVARGDEAGPLAGVPIGIKDMLLTAGVRTTFGSPLFADLVPQEDEAVVTRVLAAGAVCLGKTNVPELGFSSVGHNPLFETTTNPWDPRLTSGGSSSGSGAAVAAGECPVALGTDRAGSVRIPAAHCGLVGFKPTAGVVPSAGRGDFMTVTGPLARTVADAALLLSVIAGYDPRDPWSVPAPEPDWSKALAGDVGGLRVAVSLDWGYAPVDPEVRAVVEAAVLVFDRVLGCDVQPVDPGWADPWEDFLALAVAGIDLAGLRRAVAERGDELTPHLVAAVRRPWTAEEITNANLARIRLHERLHRILSDADLLLTPTVAVPPFGLLVQGPEKIDGRIVDPLAWIPFTFPFNMTGHPAASVPAGFTAAGLPIGLQVAGRRFEDETVVRACAAYEAVAPWGDRWPHVATEPGGP